MKRIYNIAVTLLCLVALGSCSDDTIPTPIDKPEAQVSNAKYNSLTFEWQKIKDARQYSYTLSNPDGVVIEKNVTQNTTVTISGLQPSTTYTLAVRALSQVYSDLANSEIMELTATTADLTPVATPQLTVAKKDASYVVSWTKVANATSYTYRVTDASGKEVAAGSVKTAKFTLTGLDNGEYTAYVTAKSTKGGYRDSEEASLNFTVQRSMIWTVSGTYKSAIDDKSWDADMVAYDDGTYVIEKWYGNTNYNLSFTLNEDGSQLNFANQGYQYDEYTYAYAVPTGLTGTYASIYVFDGEYSSFDGNSTKGQLSFDVIKIDGSKQDYVTDCFTWGDDEPAIVVEGTWQISLKGWECITDENGDWTEINQTGSVTIAQTGENSYSLKKLMDNTITININTQTGVASIPVQDFELAGFSLSLGDTSSASKAAVGTFEIASDGNMTIRISGLGCHYGDDNYDYFYDGAVLVLTKKK